MKSDLPKVAHRVLGVPMVEHVVNAVRRAGIDDVVVVTGFGAEVVESLLAEAGVKFARQHERLGTGHAVSCALEVTGDLSGPVVVLAGDVPLVRPETIADLVQVQEATGAACVVLSAVFSDPTGYGRIIRNESGAVTAIVEHRDLAPEQLPIAEGNVGTYCFDGEVLCAHLHRLETSNSQSEYYLTDLVAILVDEGLRVEAVILEDADESHGVNSPEQLAEVAGLLQRRIDRGQAPAGAPTVAGEPDAAVTMGAGAIPCSYDGPGAQDSSAERTTLGRDN